MTDEGAYIIMEKTYKIEVDLKTALKVEPDFRFED